MNIEITREKPISTDGLRLIAQLTAELDRRYQDHDGAGHFTADEVLQDRAVFVVARVDDVPPLRQRLKLRA